MLAALTICHAQVVDIGVESIIWPKGDVEEGYPWHPSACWHNYGTVEAGFKAWLAIYDTLGVLDYIDSTVVDQVAPEHSTRLYFRPYTPRGCSPSMLPWAVRCSTYVAGDVNNSNDVLAGSFRVGPYFM
jgi:hypothetical protein